MKAIWDGKLSEESDDSDQPSKEVPNICLMALEDEFDDNEVKFSYNELLEDFQQLHDEFKNLMSRYASLKNKNIELSNQVQHFSFAKETLKLKK